MAHSNKDQDVIRASEMLAERARLRAEGKSVPPLPPMHREPDDPTPLLTPALPPQPAPPPAEQPQSAPPKVSPALAKSIHNAALGSIFTGVMGWFPVCGLWWITFPTSIACGLWALYTINLNRSDDAGQNSDRYCAIVGLCIGILGLALTLPRLVKL